MRELRAFAAMLQQIIAGAPPGAARPHPPSSRGKDPLSGPTPPSRAQGLAVGATLPDGPTLSPPDPRGDGRADGTVPPPSGEVATGAPGRVVDALAERPALLLSSEDAPGLRRLFVVSGSRLSLGRNRVDLQRGVRNDVVLRVIPCRSRSTDPENFAATVRLSQSQLEIAIGPEGAFAVDRSSRGTVLDGTRMPPWRALPLPGTFRLDCGDGAIALAGRVGGQGVGLPVGGGLTLTPAPGALLVLLARLENAADHAYAVSDGPIRIEREDTGARISHDSHGFRVEAGPGATLALDGVPLAPGCEQACVPGLSLLLGGASFALRSPDDVDFSTP